MIQSLALAFLLAVSVLLAIWGCKTSRSGYETAPYSIVLKNGNYELRDYPELTIVETSMQRGESGRNSGFQKLFSYISGRNENRESIAMTTPVFISDDSSKMAFVLPTKSSNRIPAPLDSTLSIRKIPPGHFAVLRFNGSRSAARESENLEVLKKWIAENGFTATGTPIYGYFDPPWTPGFLRRNEVMLHTGDEPNELK